MIDKPINIKTLGDLRQATNYLPDDTPLYRLYNPYYMYYDQNVYISWITEASSRDAAPITQGGIVILAS